MWWSVRCDGTVPCGCGRGSGLFVRGQSMTGNMGVWPREASGELIEGGGVA